MRARIIFTLPLIALAVGCSSSKTTSPTTTATTIQGGVSPSGITAARCDANKSAGKITYLSGFDFAASASIVDVVVAKNKGYYDKMCLDVDLKSSFSTENYPLVAANTAQFSSGGNFTELVQQSKDGAHFVALAVEGKTGIDALVVKDGINALADLKGKTIGVKGALPPGEIAMLLGAGLKPTDYKTVLLDGFDPIAQMKLPIDALPVFKSNEPHQLDAAGVKYKLFDPGASGIPGSFGILYSNAQFVNDHPTAAQDFLRATMKGLADAIADPPAAAETCFKLITDGGNKNFLSDAGEQYRWGVEAKLVTDNTPAGEPIGLVHAASLQAEINAYTAAGVFTTAPSITGTYDESILKGVYGPDAKVVWPL
ncbi:MAG: NitT/TauT family transport system substrate-binding protein [Acidimicrobiaceae bacterium]|jgi:NitT/TauT family transport system substrate-binding protein|nr:NitT/TauT family transport system substrate-binding protein [Acidimicrobiaceae bacterium]